MTVSTVRPSLRDAYDECQHITRTQARNFHYGIRLLPAGKRAALCAVYAFARRLDDAGDAAGASTADRLARLGAARAALDRLDEQGADPVLAALADVARRYPLPVRALYELADGIEMDVRGTRYATFEELVGYCHRVAGTVGELCVAIYGWRGPATRAGTLADHLGIALQQTNILRDVREDAFAGRVYLPTEDLARFGVTVRPDGVFPPGLADLVAAAARRAEGWYCDGLRLLGLLDWRSRASCAAMAGIYHRLNDVIATHPAAIWQRRVSLGGWQKAFVVLASLAGRAP